MRLVAGGRAERAAADESIWLCLTCETCSARCPNDCDPAGVIDTLRELALEAGLAEAPRRIAAFHRAFLAQIEANGRLHEMGLVMDYKLRTGDLMKDVTNAPGMVTPRQAQPPPGPHRRRRRGQAHLRGVRPLVSAIVLETPAAGTRRRTAAREDHRLLPRLLAARDLARVRREPARRARRPAASPVAEIDDWSCCGASSGAHHRPPARRGPAGAQPGAGRGAGLRQRAGALRRLLQPPRRRPPRRDRGRRHGRAHRPTCSAARSRTRSRSGTSSQLLRDGGAGDRRARRRRPDAQPARRASSWPPTTAACSCARRRSRATTTPRPRRRWTRSSRACGATPSTGT